MKRLMAQGERRPPLNSSNTDSIGLTRTRSPSACRSATSRLHRPIHAFGRDEQVVSRVLSPSARRVTR